MTGATPMLLDLHSMRMLLKGARILGGPYGAVLELCMLTMCLPWEAVAIDLAQIDWAKGRTAVPARGGTRRTLHLPPEAIRTIVTIVGDHGGRGQAVTGGRGRPLDRRDVRLDRMQARLTIAAPETMLLQPWNFHGLRAAAARELLERGCGHRDVAHALGLKAPNSATSPIGGIRTGVDEADRAAVTVRKWNAVLSERRNARRSRPRRRAPADA